MGLGPTLMTLCDLYNLNYLFKDPVSKYSHSLRCWGQDFTMSIWGTQFSP